MSIQKKYRWDRIAVAMACLAFFSFATASWVAPDEALDGDRVLSHPTAPNELDVFSKESRQVRSEVSERASEPKSAEASEPIEEVKPCSCNKRVLRLIKNPYTAHRKAARNLPNSFFVKNRNEMNAGLRNGKLVTVTDGVGYHIGHLSHSHAMLLPEVRDLLVAMGREFAALLEDTPSAGTKFRVTSLTRTEKQQSRLTRRNYNAIDEASTHSYGASFDIAFTDRPDNSSDCSAPTRAMQQVLGSFQSDGKILVVPEGQCMHVTLRPR